MNDYTNEEDFLQLLIRYYEGVTTRREESFIKQQLQHDAHCRQLWEDVQFTFKEDIPRHLFEKQQPDSIVKKRGRYLQAVGRFFSNISAVAILVAFLMISCATALFFTNQKAQPMLLPVTDQSKSVVLELPDGERVDLTAASGLPVPTSQALLRADNESLSFTATSTGKKNGWNTLYVPKGRTYKVKLPDGTQVHINPASRLRFPTTFNNENREVYLDGEAYFDVTHDPSHPFTVHTMDADVMALGTTFNIETYDHQFITSLLSGTILVTARQKKVILHPGQAAVLDKQQELLQVESFEAKTIRSRVEGRYLFTEKPITDICQILERWYDVPIIIDRKEISSRRFTGVIFKKQPIYFFLEDLRFTDGIDHYVDTKGRLHLR